MTKKKIKLKKKPKILLAFLILIIIGTIFGIKKYQEYQYKQTYEYKLLEKSYSLDDTKVLIKYLDNTELNDILTIDYNSNIVNLVSEKYFIFDNLQRYLDYISENLKESMDNVVALVNVNRDRDYYEDVEDTDISLGSSMIVNKYYGLSEDYEPENLVTVSSTYSYSGNSLNQEAYDAFKTLADDAKTAGYTILIVSSYRDYDSQDSLWNARKTASGTKSADSYAARAGHSEHQTGYAIDVADYYDTEDDFGNTDAYTWMIENCYKYGYILRYPEDKENITGYSYEPWHFRYVGVDIATKIYQENITFDEYYAYYVAK